VHVQLFDNRFSVTKTHSQDFKHAYAYNSTATEHYTGVGVVCRTVHTCTMLAHHTLHSKNLENCNIIQSFSGWLSRMTTNYCKYVEHITVILQEFVTHMGTTNLKSSVQRISEFLQLQIFSACTLGSRINQLVKFC